VVVKFAELADRIVKNVVDDFDRTDPGAVDIGIPVPIVSKEVAPQGDAPARASGSFLRTDQGPLGMSPVRVVRPVESIGNDAALKRDVRRSLAGDVNIEVLVRGEHQ
jgi:hypothetical protein